ncbi:DUF1702 family protein [Maricurvus nonylphenolicus]|uniref:DUF1702 family protein n=1 Tax=Maricurvus nonylphenolicus TaxID=1008307 RepID=UPI0036F3BB4D
MTTIKQPTLENLSDLTSVAIENVYTATALAKQGYSQALREQLDSHDAWTRGWFSEGIAQGLYFHDLKKDNDFEDCLKYIEDGLPQDCKGTAYAGFGLAIAHTGVFSESFYNKLNSDERFWVFDGLGFYKLMVAEKPRHESLDVPEFVDEDSERVNAFYAGVGRALWFSIGEKNIDTVVDAIQSFPEDQQGPIWRGVGFVSTYAGGNHAALAELKARSGNHIEHVKIGCIIAILGQGHAMVAHRETAAQTYLGKGIDEITEKTASLRDQNQSVRLKPTSAEWGAKVQALLK